MATIFDIKKYAIHDGPGIRTTIFFKGCPLSCRWCHNPESWQPLGELSWRMTRCTACGKCAGVCRAAAITLDEKTILTDPDKCTLCGDCIEACPADARESIGTEMTVDEIMTEIEKDTVFYDQSGGGVTFSGGEPLSQLEPLCQLLKRCKAREIHTAIDTTCCAPAEAIEAVQPDTDLFLCDIKHTDTDIHKKFTGVGNELILKNIEYLAEKKSPIIVRIPLIGGFNDDPKNIEATAKFIASLPNVNRVDLLPYNAGGIDKNDRLVQKYPIDRFETVNDAKTKEIIAKLTAYGLEVTIAV